jgi:hypothetical protein
MESRKYPVVQEPPEIMDLLEEHFPGTKKGFDEKLIIIAFNGKIHAKCINNVVPWNYAHESKHLDRQGTTFQEALDYVKRYIADPEFRLEVEIEGYNAGYKEFCRCIKDRNAQKKYAMMCVENLSNPFYGLQKSTIDSEEIYKRITAL